MISVITPTYRNGPELEVAIASLNEQTFQDWQHVIVADGPDPELRARLEKLGYKAHGKRIFMELGRNWHGFMGGDNAPTPEGRPGTRGGRGSRGSMAARAGIFLASGEYICYLDSDCRYLPDHLDYAAAALTPGIDFVYTKVRRIVDGRILDVIGTGTPVYSAIDGNGVVHTAELLKIANWRWGGDSDWDVIGRWIEAGAAYTFVPVITVDWSHAGSDLWTLRGVLG